MLSNLVGEAWRGMVDYLRDRRKCIAQVKEFDTWAPEERRELLNRYGLTRDGFEKAMHMPFASEDLASAALRAIDVDPNEFHREHDSCSRVVRRNCTLCRTKYRCRRDLMNGSFKQNYQSYCPNASHLSELLGKGTTCTPT